MSRASSSDTEDNASSSSDVEVAFAACKVMDAPAPPRVARSDADKASRDAIYDAIDRAINIDPMASQCAAELLSVAHSKSDQRKQLHDLLAVRLTMVIEREPES